MFPIQQRAVGQQYGEVRVSGDFGAVDVIEDDFEFIPKWNLIKYEQIVNCNFALGAYTFPIYCSANGSCEFIPTALKFAFGPLAQFFIALIREAFRRQIFVGSGHVAVD